MHIILTDLTSDEAEDIVANSRKNPLEAWRMLQKRYDPTTGGRKRNLLLTVVSLGRYSHLELQAELGKQCESYVSSYQKKLKNKMNDQIKLARLEALVPEELEKHLILNSNRLRTFADARLEIVMDVEAIFGFKFRDSKTSDTGSREHSDPKDVGAVNSLSCQVKEKGSSVSRVWCFQVRWSTLSMQLKQDTCKNRLAKEQVMVQESRQRKEQKKKRQRQIQRTVHRCQRLMQT